MLRKEKKNIQFYVFPSMALQSPLGIDSTLVYRCAQFSIKIREYNRKVEYAYILNM